MFCASEQNLLFFPAVTLFIVYFGTLFLTSELVGNQSGAEDNTPFDHFMNIHNQEGMW